MLLKIPVFLFATSFNVVAASLNSQLHRRDLAATIAAERTIALQGALDNIGPNGAKAPGAYAGVVVASPSTDDPNYYYTWIRDSALTFKMLVDELLTGNTSIKPLIEDYVKSQAIIQTVSNPSGSLSSGRGLGEPKFYVNETRFNGPWGRPQRDGPALRAITLIAYTRWLLKNDGTAEAKADIWPVIRNDLNYVAQFWNQTGFDLWEEVSGSSFFTLAVQHRALVEGAAIAKQMGFSCAGCDSQSPNILCFLQSFWNGKHIVANINTAVQRTGIDSNTILGSIATFDPDAYCMDATFQPCSHRALANLKVYVDSFRDIYDINAGIPASSAVATGRYAEDIYFNGNPWYLCTLAVAEQLYGAIQQWLARHNLFITEVDLAFWQSIYPQAKIGQYNSGTSSFDNLTSAAMRFADGFVEIVDKYVPVSGSLSEQYSRENGTALSAHDLTWSYASYVTMAAARRAATTVLASAREPIQVPSWGERSANSVPSVCVASSVAGNYTPATGAGTLAGAGGCTVTVLFRVNATTYYGENIYLTGNTTDLGNWSPAEAVPGNAANYTSERPLWYFEIDLPASTAISYKYLRQESNGSWLYESQNRTYAVPVCGTQAETGSAIVEDAWVGPTGTPSKG